MRDAIPPVPVPPTQPVAGVSQRSDQANRRDMMNEILGLITKKLGMNLPAWNAGGKEVLYKTVIGFLESADIEPLSENGVPENQDLAQCIELIKNMEVSS